MGIPMTTEITILGDKTEYAESLSAEKYEYAETLRDSIMNHVDGVDAREEAWIAALLGIRVRELQVASMDQLRRATKTDEEIPLDEVVELMDRVTDTRREKREYLEDIGYYPLNHE